MRYLLVLAVLMIVGCGQKGALFLPSQLPTDPPEEMVNSGAAPKNESSQ